MKHVFCIVKIILRDCMYCINTAENMLKYLGKKHTFDCCDIRTKSFKNVHLIFENSTKVNKK